MTDRQTGIPGLPERVAGEGGGLLRKGRGRKERKERKGGHPARKGERMGWRQGGKGG